MIITKYDLIRAYPELCREIAHEAGLTIRTELIRRAKEWQKGVVVMPKTAQ